MLVLAGGTFGAAHAGVKSLYWSETTNWNAPGIGGAVYTALVDGSDKRQLASGFNRIDDVEVDLVNGKLYWNNWASGASAANATEGIYRSNIDGTAASQFTGAAQSSTINGQASGMHGMCLDPLTGTIYFTRGVSYADSGIGPEISRIGMDGSGYVKLNANNDGWFLSGIVLDPRADNLYWGSPGVLNTGSGGAVNRMSSDGTNRQYNVVSHTDGRGRSLALDADQGLLFFSAWSIQAPSSGGGIWVFDLGSGVVTQILNDPATGIPDIEVDTDGRQVYWTDFARGEIRRAAYDGSCLTTVMVGLTNPFGLALIPEPGATADCNQNGLTDCADITSGGFGIAEAINFSVGSAPHSVTPADLNGDRVSDLAVASHNSAEVLVFLNTHDGTGALETAVSYRVGASPLGVVAEDLDGDGDIDLGASNTGSNSVSVLLNDGDGTFLLGGEYSTGPSPHAPASGDLDGDGAVDIITADFGGSQVSVLLNLGAGSFAAPVSFGTGACPIIVACGDLDGDRDLDLAAGNNDSATVSVLQNRGDGTFAPKVDVAVGSLPMGLVMTDLDGDLDLDLVTANFSSNTVSLLRNDGTGVFAPQVTLGTGAGPLSVAAGDLDLDGDSDLAVSSSVPGGAVSVFLNEGRGTFAAPLTRTVGSYPRWVATGDLNGDGVLDVVTANAGPNSLSALLSEMILATSRDCNRNGIPDECDISSGVTEDCSANGIPDECELPRALPREGLVLSLSTDAGLEIDASGGVAKWLDQSGAGQDFIQDEPARRPRIVEGAGPGGREVIQFDGVDDVLRNGSQLVPGSSFTIFTVMGVLEPGYPLALGETFSPPSRFTYEGHPVGGVTSTDYFDFAHDDGNDARATLPGIGDSRFKVLTITGTGSLSDIQVFSDGVPAAMTLTGVNQSIVFSPGNNLGGTGGRTPKLFTRVAYVAFVLYARKLNQTDREAVERILGRSAAPEVRDCNGNARPDSCDIAEGASKDCNEDGVPDDCQTAVIDNGLPRLTLLDKSPLSVECGTAYVEPGAIAQDDCAGDLSGSVHTAGDVDPGRPGSYTVSYSVADPAGNEARIERTVVVRDSTPPELTCPGVVAAECRSAEGALVSFDVAAYDRCDPAPRVTCVPASGSTFPIGRSRVECAATDAAGNVSECSFEVVVLESEPPAIQCPGTITVECTSEAGAAVGFSVAATDNCDGAPSVTCVPAPASTFPVGTSHVVCTAVDAAGNQSQCAFEVVVTCRGGQVPGDCNQDGERDISDAICVLGFLFTGLPQSLPCGDGSDLDPANARVFSWNSDGAIDLSDAVGMLTWLFLGGPEHVLGPECRRVPGCPDVCTP